MFVLTTENPLRDRSLPNSARRLDNDAWVMGLATAPQNLREATGWYEITDVARPADTPTHTYDRSITLVAGKPTVTWTQRAFTASELVNNTANANRTLLLTQAANALAANTTYLAIATPTTNQAVTQVRALTVQVNKLIRLAANVLDGTD